MSSVSTATFFAPAERSAPGTIDRQRRVLSQAPAVGALLDSFPEPAAIINSDRQIICSNDKLAQWVGRPGSSLVGLRIGEAIGCEHGSACPNGCGTTPACANCGAAKGIAQALEDAVQAI